MKNEWISVKDKIPSEREKVLCFNGYRMMDTSWHEWTNHDKEWFMKTWTHWMPLPLPPSEEKKEIKPTIEGDIDTPLKNMTKNAFTMTDKIEEQGEEKGKELQRLKDKGLIDNSYVAMDKVNEICDKAELREELIKFANATGYYDKIAEVVIDEYLINKE